MIQYKVVVSLIAFLRHIEWCILLPFFFESASPSSSCAVSAAASFPRLPPLPPSSSFQSNESFFPFKGGKINKGREEGRRGETEEETFFFSSSSSSSLSFFKKWGQPTKKEREPRRVRPLCIAFLYTHHSFLLLYDFSFCLLVLCRVILLFRNLVVSFDRKSTADAVKVAMIPKPHLLRSVCMKNIQGNFTPGVCVGVSSQLGRNGENFPILFGKIWSCHLFLPKPKKSRVQECGAGGPFSPSQYSPPPLSPPPPLHYFLSETEACLRKFSPSSLPRRRPSKSPNLEEGGERRRKLRHTRKEEETFILCLLKGRGRREVYSSSSRSPLRSRLRRLCKPPKYTREFLVPNRVPPPPYFPLLHGM